MNITAEDKSMTFPDTSVTYTVTYSGFADGEDESTSGIFTVTGAFGSAYDGTVYAATYPITATTQWTAANYTITHVSGTLTIDRAQISVPADMATDYTGVAQSLPTGAVGYDLSVASGTTIRDADTYTVTATLKAGYAWSGGSLTDETISWVISPVALEITPNDETVTFPAGFTGDPSAVTYLGLVGDDITDVAGAFTAVGTVVSVYDGSDYGNGTFAITASGWTSGNYTISYGTGTLTVNKAKAVAPTGENLIYNGLEQTGVQGETGYTLSVTAEKNVGDYTATATLISGYEWSDGHGADERDISWSITPATLTAAYVSETVTFGIPPALTVSVTGFVNGETALTAAGYTAPAVTDTNVNVGTYILTPFGGEADNYIFNYVSGTLIIERAAQGGITFSGYGGVYDGNAHGITVNPDGGTVFYSVDGGPYEAANPIYTDVGEHTVNFKVVRENYEDYHNSALVSIIKANYDMSGIIWSGVTFVYNGEEQSVTVSGLPDNVTVLEYTDNKATVVGDYQAIATFVYDETNYNAPVIPYHGWSIEAAPQEDVTYSGFEGAYDGTFHAIVVVSSGGGEITYLNTVSDDYDLTESPAYKNVGEYWVYFKVVKENYEDYMGAALIRISKAHFVIGDITWSGDRFTYDGTVKSVFISDGLPAGITVYEYTGNQGMNAGLYTANATFIYDSHNYTEPEIPSHGWNIDKAPLTISAENKTVTFPQEAPPFTVDYSGFVNGEDETVLGGTLIFACAYDRSVYEATYAITPSGLTSGNYDIFFSAGILTVERASLAVPAAVTGLIYNGGLQTGVLGATGFTLSGVHEATDAGDYTATATLSPGYIWSDSSVSPKEIVWSISQRQISDAVIIIDGDADLEYTGSAVMPGITVTLDGAPLDAANYTVSYTDNTEAGTVTTITVTATGSYAGTKTVTFTIEVRTVTVTPTTGQSKIFGQDDPELMFGLSEEGARDHLTGALTREEGESASTYAILIGSLTVTGGNHSLVFTDGVTFEITARDIAEAGIIVDGDDLIFTGGLLKPDFSVILGTELVPGTDYTMTEHTEGTNAGDVITITVTGTGNYAGTATTVFSVAPKNIGGAGAGITGTYIHTGTAVTPTLGFTDTYVTSGDYDVAYDDLINAGTVTATITGKGNYTGITTVTFTILRAELVKPTATDMTFTFTGGEQTYVPGGVTGEMTVAGNKRTNAGSQTVTVSITDKTNYQWTDGGQADVMFTFTIAPKSISDAVIDPIDVQIHTGRPVTPEMTVRVGGIVLIRDVDYTVSYTNNIRAGTATATVTGTGNYEGTAAINFSIELEEPDNVGEWGTTLGASLLVIILLLFFVRYRMRNR